jgi:5'-nucleotidase
LILGGHTHRFFDQPRVYSNKQGLQVFVNQVGWGGIQLGRLDFDFFDKKASLLDNNQSPLIVKKNVE